MIVVNNEDCRLDICIENLLRERLPDKYLAGDEFIIAIISANSRRVPSIFGPEPTEFEFTLRAHHNGNHPNLQELHQLANVFEAISNIGFRGLHCTSTEFVGDQTGENLTARFIVTRDLLEFHHF